MRRDRLTGHELEQFERAIEWAQWARMGTNDEIRDLAAVEESVPRGESPALAGFLVVERAGIEPGDLRLAKWEQKPEIGQPRRITGQNRPLLRAVGSPRVATVRHREAATGRHLFGWPQTRAHACHPHATAARERTTRTPTHVRRDG
jgi:hypothetical protein